MASRHFSSLLRSRVYPSLLKRAAPTIHSHLSHPIYPNTSTTVSIIRQLATSSSRRSPPRSSTKVDIGARARQIQSRRLWTYALTFSCVAGFIVIVLNNFQDALVFYITPSEALEKYIANPTRNRFRLGGLVLEGSISHPAGKPEMEFVITDLLTEILVKYEGEVPDLFREGHSVVAEGFVREFEGEEDRGRGGDQEGRVAKVTSKARNGECYFKAVEVLAKHDEKYMPKEVAEALDRNKKKIKADQAAAVVSSGETKMEEKEKGGKQ